LLYKKISQVFSESDALNEIGAIHETVAKEKTRATVETVSTPANSKAVTLEDDLCFIIILSLSGFEWETAVFERSLSNIQRFHPDSQVVIVNNGKEKSLVHINTIVSKVGLKCVVLENTSDDNTYLTGGAQEAIQHIERKNLTFKRIVFLQGTTALLRELPNDSGFSGLTSFYDFQMSFDSDEQRRWVEEQCFLLLNKVIYTKSLPPSLRGSFGPNFIMSVDCFKKFIEIGFFTKVKTIKKFHACGLERLIPIIAQNLDIPALCLSGDINNYPGAFTRNIASKEELKKRSFILEKVWGSFR